MKKQTHDSPQIEIALHKRNAMTQVINLLMMTLNVLFPLMIYIRVAIVPVLERAAHAGAKVFSTRNRIWLLSGIAAFIALEISYGPELFAKEMFLDEKIYAKAAYAVLNGEDPTSVRGWYYPAPAAALLAKGFETIGWYYSFLITRILNALGLLAVISLTGSTIGMIARKPYRWLMAPAVTSALLVYTAGDYDWWLMGNVSGIIIGCMIIAIESRSKLVRVLALASSFLMKPYALGLLLSRVLTRPLTKSWTIWLLPMGMFLLMYLLSPHVDITVALEQTAHSHQRSPWRILVLYLGLPEEVILMTLGFLATVWARGNIGRALCIGWCFLPVAWYHSSTMLFIPWSFALYRWWGSRDQRAAVAMPALALSLAILAGLPMIWEYAWILGPELTRVLSIFARWIAPTIAVVIIGLLTQDPPWIKKSHPEPLKVPTWLSVPWQVAISRFL